MVFLLAAIVAEHRRKRFDVLHAFWAQGCGTAGGIAGALLGVRRILTLAGGELAALPDIGYGGRLTWRGRAEAALACRLADRITAPSAHLCRLASALGIAAVHVPLGVSLDRWPPSAPRRRDPARPIRLLHVASLNRVKDQPMLLRAAESLRERGCAFELTIVGEDTLGGRIQRQAAILGLGECVRFLGFLPHARLRPWVERSDLLVMTSRHEAGPLVMLEAALAGVPTIGTAVGHVADFAPDAAVSVDVGDSDALAAGILRLAGEEEKRLALARHAQARALEHDARATIRRHCALYAVSG